MIYDSLIKKVEDFNKETVGKHKYFLEFTRGFFWYFLPLLIIFIATLNIYLLIADSFNMSKLGLNIFLIFMALYNIRIGLRHINIIDFEGKILKIERQIFNLDDIKSITLKHMVIPKGRTFSTCLIIVTSENIEYIAPVYTGKKVEFIGYLKLFFGNKFKIVK